MLDARNPWAGSDTHVNSAHVYIRAKTSAGTSLGEISYGPGTSGGVGADTDFAAMGLCKVITPSMSAEEWTRVAENSKAPIKRGWSNRNLEIEVEALVGNNAVLSCCHGVIQIYEDTNAWVPASPEEITGDAVLFFLRDDGNWLSTDCTFNGGIYLPNATIIPLGEGVSSLDGKDVKTYKLKIVAAASDKGNFYCRLGSGTGTTYTTINTQSGYITYTPPVEP